MNGMGVVQIAILIVIVAAVVGLVYVALRQFGVAIPGWVVQVFWIVVVAFVIILAIKFVAGFALAAAPRVQATEPESHYRDQLALVLGGETEHRLSDGTSVDVLTDDVAFEVDFPHRLWNATGQSLWYGKRTNRTPGIYLVVRNNSDEAWVKRARMQCRELGILLFVRDVRQTL